MLFRLIHFSASNIYLSKHLVTIIPLFIYSTNPQDLMPDILMNGMLFLFLLQVLELRQ